MALHRLALVAGFDDRVPLALDRQLEHRAKRVFVFDEENGRTARERRRASAEPAGRDTGAARLVLDIGNGLGLLRDVGLDAILFGDGGETLLLDDRALRGIVS